LFRHQAPLVPADLHGCCLERVVDTKAASAHGKSNIGKHTKPGFSTAAQLQILLLVDILNGLTPLSFPVFTAQKTLLTVADGGNSAE